MPLPEHPLSTDIRGQFVFLGTGTSVGVPIPGCDCATCRSGDGRNQRTRCGLAVGLPEGNLLVDTPTDLRSQLLREQIALVHAVLYTHDHADHLFGLDDLRVLSFYLGGKIPLYCEELVENRIRRSFDYAFSKDADTLHEGSIPQLRFVRITTAPFELLGTQVVPIRLKHGRSDVLGFRFGNVAYCTDTSGIPDESWPLLEGLDVLVLDALRHKPHATHFSLQQAVAVARQLRPRRTLFTHMGHDLEHAATNAELPQGMELAYDGLKVPLM
jgi:phosphoribosyl 1,2-cyclic phosphate phosphodiesterase